MRPPFPLPSLRSFRRLLRPSPPQPHAWQQYGRCTWQHQFNRTSCLCIETTKAIHPAIRLNLPQKTRRVLNPSSATTHPDTKRCVRSAHAFPCTPAVADCEAPSLPGPCSLRVSNLIIHSSCADIPTFHGARSIDRPSASQPWTSHSGSMAGGSQSQQWTRWHGSCRCRR